VASVSLMPTEPQGDQAHALAKRLAEPRTAAAVKQLSALAPPLLDKLPVLEALLSNNQVMIWERE
jgi:hypothetical protein